MRSLLVMAAVVLGGCGLQHAEPPGETIARSWRGEVVEEGDVTFVRNLEGSVWGVPAELAEETSIGLLEGDEPYLFGDVVSLAADDTHIVALDGQIPTVRIYDSSGVHLRDLGQGGQGPGEYVEPRGLAILGERVFVRDAGRGKLIVFSVDGTLLHEWDIGDSLQFSASPLVLLGDGTSFVLESVSLQTGAPAGMRRMDPQGRRSDWIEPAQVDRQRIWLRARSPRSSRAFPPPVFPGSPWAMGAWGRMYSGAADRYEFLVQELDPHRYIVSRAVEGARISSSEAAAIRRGLTRWARQSDPDWTWDLPDIPSRWPAFHRFFPGAGGALWVLRNGASRRIASCVEDDHEVSRTRVPGAACWAPTYRLDVFDQDGRFVTQAPAPPGLVITVAPAITGDRFVALVRDDAGTETVRRYRLVRSAAAGS